MLLCQVNEVKIKNKKCFLSSAESLSAEQKHSRLQITQRMNKLDYFTISKYLCENYRETVRIYKLSLHQ